MSAVLAILTMDTYSTAMFPMTFRSFSSLLRAGVALGMICVILGLAPFAVAQDVHHELAAADSDGHEHSDTDICQWVQHHIAGSVDLDLPRLAVCDVVRHRELPSEFILLSAALSLVGPSRAPPQV
ncbi:MAG TPA: hypothetical protein VFX10_03640 [Nitrospira sp.]|nr:hypothetical protein [Nitrospira sp.]